MTVHKLHELCDILYGFPFQSKYFSDEKGIRLIRIRDLKKTENITYYNGPYDKKYAVKNGDMLVGMDGEFNCIIWQKGKGVLNQRVAKITPISTINEGYLYNIVKVKLKTIEQNTPYSTVKHLLTGQLKNMQISLPSLKHQNKISTLLNSIQNIQNKITISYNLLKQIPETYFLEHFSKKQPNTKIQDVSFFIGSGITPRGGKKNYQTEGTPFIRSQNVLMNELKFENIAFIPYEIHEAMKRTWVRTGDVLLNITGASIGRVAVYRGPDNSANVNQHVCIIRLKDKIALPDYIAYHLSSPSSQNQIWTIQIGASRQALNMRQIKSLDIYLPPLDVQGNFVSIVEKYRKIKEDQNQSLINIQELFSSVLKKTLSADVGTSKASLLNLT